MLTQTEIHNGSFNQSTIRVMPSASAKQHDDPIEMLGAPMSFSRNTEIYGEGEPADYIYKVLRGAVRTYKILADGRRQIGGFHEGSAAEQYRRKARDPGKCACQ